MLQATRQILQCFKIENIKFNTVTAVMQDEAVKGEKCESNYC